MKANAKVKDATWWFQAVAAKHYGTEPSVTFVIDRQDELLGLVEVRSIEKAWLRVALSHYEDFDTVYEWFLKNREIREKYGKRSYLLENATSLGNFKKYLSDPAYNFYAPETLLI